MLAPVCDFGHVCVEYPVVAYSAELIAYCALVALAPLLHVTLGAGIWSLPDMLAGKPVQVMPATVIVPQSASIFVTVPQLALPFILDLFDNHLKTPPQD
jgi:hypothetical protein